MLEPGISFAKLVPNNKAAILAYSRLWDAMQRDLQRKPPLYNYHQHHRSFMAADPQQVSLGTALSVNTEAMDGIADSTDASVMPGKDPLDEQIWTGQFVFNLGNAPEIQRLGWRCGYGRWKNDQDLGRVDIVLCLPEDGRKSRVRGNHLLFKFLDDSAAFAVHVLHPLKVDTETFTNSNSIYTLNKVRHVVTVGEMSYVFSYTIPAGQQEEFQELRNLYVQSLRGTALPLTFATPTPSEEDIHVGPWCLSRTLGRGSESAVASAISPQGARVAVKELSAKKSAIDKEKEVERYKSIREAVRGDDAQFLITFYDSIASKLEVTYIFFKPLVQYDLTLLLNGSMTVARPVLGELFLQAMRGVGALHAAGFMHRDLKPGNIGVRSINPPFAVVLDLGQAIRVDKEDRLAPSPGCHGTVGYIAPEVEDTNNLYKQGYGHPADIWSMGCVAVQMLTERYFGPRLPWNRTSKFNPWRTFGTFRETSLPDRSQLQEQIAIFDNVTESIGKEETPFGDLLFRMLSKGPHWRPPASEVVKEFSTFVLADWEEVSPTTDV